ncbi:RNA polymerase sigma factor [Sediminibacterium soli]|uniref:RNA polymerase sigma factor n=1 Tax=Sediminibacterium soli TaxID=2698829 RepID=UPI0013795D34|nr:sigma-70 family RNA polymerase sigma factor [Sediminibacterium soli]NCI46923.1 sigma-70 family RNA polymerase sigma factor [Sediminibacterium soli]
MPREIPHISSLIAGCCRNDRNSQRDLYHGLYGYAMKICFRYVNKPEEAEELVSESFVKLFRNIGQFDGNRVGDTEALLKGWFKRIVVNTSIDYLRRTQLKTVNHEISDDDGTFVDAQENGMDKISYDEIIGAIRKLTPVYRTVFNLFVIEGFSHEEIAAQLGISVGASKSNLSKARNNLRKMITQQTDYRLYA